MTKNEVEKILRDACGDIYHHDKYLIDKKTHEQDIAAHILCFIKKQLDSNLWSVDVEYNRENNSDPKKDINGNPLKPDIIIHRRGPKGPNLVAIEIKGYWNHQSREEDRDSLLRLQKKHGYKFLYQLELGKDTFNLIPVLEN